MKTHRIPFVTMGLFALLTFSLTGSVFAQPHHDRGFWADLTDEQRGLIQAKISEMKDQGATWEEIHEAITEMLEEFGIELHEHWGGPHGSLGIHLGPLWEDLTKEQREAIRNTITEMQEQGATREEIHEAVTELLEGFGIELPENWGKGPPHSPGFGPGPAPFLGDLTDEQRTALRQKMREMREQGATREEIREAMVDMLEEYGLEFPKEGEGVSSEAISVDNSDDTSSDTILAEDHILQ